MQGWTIATPLPRISPDTERLHQEREVPYVLCIALATLGYVWLPSFAFSHHPLPGYVNNGIISISDDMPVYLSAIRQGALGHLLYLDQFTTAPIGRVLMYPLYTASGFLLRPTGWSPEQIFMLLRLIGDISLIASLWLLVRTFMTAGRVAAYALCLLSAGALPIALLLNPNPLPFLNGSFGVIQLLLLPPPHIALGIACETLAVVLYVRIIRLRSYLSLYVTLLLLGLVYPFGLPAMLALFCGDALIQAVEQRQITRHLPVVCLGTCIAALIPLYYWWLLHRDPVWSKSALLSVASWPSLALLAWIYAPTLLLALPRAWRRTNRLLALWPVLAVASGLLTGSQPERMLAGVTVPLALLAIQRLSSFPRLLGPGVLVLSLGGLLLPLLFVRVVQENRNQVFMPVAIQAIGNYLAPRTTARDVILANYRDSNMLAGLTPARVIAGHGSQTLDLRSSARVALDYVGESDTQRIAVEGRYHVTYVVIQASRYPLLARHMIADSRYTPVWKGNGYLVFHVSTARGASTQCHPACIYRCRTGRARALAHADVNGDRTEVEQAHVHAAEAGAEHQLAQRGCVGKRA